jgi:iron complex transport system ATP-binding protein
MSRLRSDNITLAYGEAPVVDALDLTVPDGEITTIIGPNGCGKSTLLRALARLKRPAGGSVILDGQLIHHLPTREVAKRLGLLSQQSIPPAGITVEDLARRGRYPHQGFMQPPSRQDDDSVALALDLAGMTHLRQRAVDELSGGQRQRAWIAMVLAQETPLLLLDEPTTFLDLAHQLQIVDLVRRLNQEEARTVVMVLHDVNEAARVSHRIVAMKGGKIVQEGPPEEIMRADCLAGLYGVACDVHTHPTKGHRFCVPRGVHHVGPSSPTEASLFDVERLETGYGRVPVIRGLSATVPAGAVTSIIGPNACGKSTLLRTCGRLLRPSDGRVRLHGEDVRRGSHRNLSRRLALLSQGPTAPSGFLVEDLVAAGRVPHQGLLRQWRIEDETVVEDSLARCNLADLRFREVESLSGGQRQRAWFGMALAQDTPVLLLDEPTTFLDLAAQIELLDLVRALNRERGRSIVMVLHDLTLAARYSDYLIAMKDGEVAAAGPPAQVITSALLRQVFGIEAAIVADPVSGAPIVLPERAVESTPTEATENRASNSYATTA